MTIPVLPVNSPDYYPVQRAYRQEELARICMLPEQDFGAAFGMETVKIELQRSRYRQQPPDSYYHFRDNGAHVLAVAHLDTVVNPECRTPHFCTTRTGEPMVVSGALDDRLGAYVILQLLPKLGINCDWLLTVNEEFCQSTAKFFTSAGKKYDWVIEFDRAGTDVVMYQYEDSASRQAVRTSGAKMSYGSYSDIADLEHLGVKAFNWGVGYDGNYHSERGYACLNDTFTMVAKYLRFHTQNAGITMPHEEIAIRYDEDDYDAPIPTTYQLALETFSLAGQTSKPLTWKTRATRLARRTRATLRNK